MPAPCLYKDMVLGKEAGMIRLAFRKEKNNNVVCSGPDEKIYFMINQYPFINRVYRFYDGALLFDGYSVWFKGGGEEIKKQKAFSLSFFFVPFGYSDQGDGLFSCLDGENKEGFYLLIQKHGKVQAGFGNGREIFNLSSINAHAKKDAYNMVTVIFRQEEGWCDLYVNGVLSNRKQFPRHMWIKWPQREAYLGKYVNNGDCGEELEAGSFYGLIKEILFHEGALSEEEVKKLHGEYPLGERTEKILPERKDYKNDRQRPVYHLIAPGKWMNEPHGPFCFQGLYHIFYQSNPHAPIWNHIQWGHMVSKDMIHWSDMPLALETGDESLDPDGCWSGSALIDKKGTPWIFYTAGNNNKFPNQFVAMAQAQIDEGKKLSVWKKLQRPVVEQKEGWLGEFRDPFVWLENDTYFMLVGTGDKDNGGGNAVLYSSKDMLNWQSHGFFLNYSYEKNREVGHVFELPVLLPLKDESGCIACHIFLLCACQVENDVVETYGFLGKWEPDKFKFSPYHEKALLIDLGKGVFTGPSGFVTPDGRSVVFSIAQGKRSGRDDFYAGWAHNGGIPIELFIQKGELCVRPVKEVYQLKKKRLLVLKNVSAEEADRQLQKYSGNCLWMKVCADAKRIILDTIDGSRKKTVYYDRENCRFGWIDEKGIPQGRYRGPEDNVNIGSGLVNMEYFLDHSMIEVYLNDKKSITLRNYIQGRERRIGIAGEAAKILELELWEMDSAYK